MHFKQLFLETLMLTYRGASELNIYEDRPKHVKGFRDFFAEFNYRMGLPSGVGAETEAEASSSGPAKSLKRSPIKAEVIQVTDTTACLDPVVEVAEVQRMVNSHNRAIADGTHTGSRLQIKRTVFFTSYSIPADDAKKLNKLANLPAHLVSNDIKFHGTNILISIRPCSHEILSKIGGMGAKMVWRVVAVGHLNNMVWAAQVEPVPADAAYHTEGAVPMVVLAHQQAVMTRKDRLIVAIATLNMRLGEMLHMSRTITIALLMGAMAMALAHSEAEAEVEEAGEVAAEVPIFMRGGGAEDGVVVQAKHRVGV
ncbi:hypothetical protein CFO_g994 [Ceratocystis platani]|uniref:Swiss Army Knife RNA repair protein HAD domain-containing protein n=1 Tax=Ceratocystis fimbriata f. sp. platani TaxID=88771 RepID=A0A0F8B4B4_CERFI|nr:hypothetical protein CFO_g994 [Ceratocystis platani]